MSNSTTIKELAKMLNVSVSTVSRALHNSGRIGLSTKMKIQKLAKELHYEPNKQAISLRQKKNFVVGVVLPFFREEFFSAAIDSIEAMAMEHEYTILFGQSHDDYEREKKVVETMRKQRVDGLIISLSKQTTNYDHLLELDKYNIPLVYFDRIPTLSNINNVFCNLYNGTVEMISLLVNNGYKRIALINGPAKLVASKDRLNGYIDGLAKKKLKADMQLVWNTDLSKENTYSAMRSILALKKLPQAVISFNDYVHMDAANFATKNNVRVNEDIVFVSYANLPITAYTAFPPLVSIEQYPQKQGEKAMEMMIRLITKKANKETDISYYSEEIDPVLIQYSQLK